MALTITPLPDAPFGALVEGWDPAVEPDEELVAAVRAALAANPLLLFRGHRPPDDAELIRFAAAFGELFDGGELFGVTSPTREILQLTSQRNEIGTEAGPSAATPLPWHTDYSYLPRAAKETFLEALALPDDGGGRTWFSDLYGAWEALPEARRAELEGLVAVHTIKGSGRHLDKEQRSAAVEGRDRRHPDFSYPGGRKPARHPIAHRHPETGRVALYVSSLVAEVEGVPEPAGRELLDELMAHATAPERVYGHRWAEGDLIMFDDVGTIHRRDPSDPDQVRTMRQLSTVLADDGLASSGQS